MEDLKNNPIVLLVNSGLQLEKEDKFEEAQKLYMQAWDSSSNTYEKCVAAHFVARHQNNSEDTLRWNIEALHNADMTEGELVKTFYPSLYLCVGMSYEDVGNYAEAQKYFDLSAEKVTILPDDTYGQGIRENLAKAIERIKVKGF